MIERNFQLTNAFKRDLKKHYLALVSKSWAEVVEALATGKALPERYKDHALTGNLAEYRDCHIKPDLVLSIKLRGIR